MGEGKYHEILMKRFDAVLCRERSEDKDIGII
jgi:hypothetical protein